MDLTSILLQSMLSDSSVKSLSKKTGSSKDEVSSVLTAALPLLLQGAGQQAEDEETAESFAQALAKHGESDTSDMDSYMDSVDMADGAKILAHLLGAQEEEATKKVSKKSGTSSDSTAQILSAAAPLLMSMLGQEDKKSTTKKSSKKASGDLVGALLASAIENVNVTELLMSALTDSLSADAEEEAPKKKAASTKKTTTAKKTTAKKSTTTKKTTTTKKKAASSTTKKKAASSKKKAADDGIDAADVAKLLTSLLK
ncbi:MAG: DUF937 domain-containing protein [Oscillospiraceae bacterium]|nr:DUF937 domain-containing protein [Oscillospiraceae bacterium]